MFRFICLGCLGALALSACAPTAVTGFNGNSIRIQSQSSVPTPEVVAEAQRICATEGLNAEYASTRTNDYNRVSNHLFLCLTTAKPNAGLPVSSGRSGSGEGYFDSTSTM